ncbi:MAG: TIGR02147 family protein [Halobacteriovoraceae bacterium]|nr:TIGR02147 family protein [Halobacteriovoraceae bacterium]
MEKLPQIYDYRDYRAFLKDLIDYKMSVEKRLSFRRLSNLTGYTTPNHYQKIISNQKNMSPRGAREIAKLFNLNPAELKILLLLMKYNDSKKHDVKINALKKLIKNQKYRLHNPNVEEVYKYYSQWYYVAIRELSLLDDFQDDPQWIAKTLIPNISVAEAVQALLDLTKLGIIKRGVDGKIVSAVQQHIDFRGEVPSHTIANYHKNMINMGRESIDRINRDERDITSVTLPIPIDKISELKSYIKDIQNNFREKVHSYNSPDSIFQLNMQLFPISVVKNKNI